MVFCFVVVPGIKDKCGKAEKRTRTGQKRTRKNKSRQLKARSKNSCNGNTAKVNKGLLVYQLPSGDKSKVDDMYYSISMQREESEGISEEILKNIANQRPVIKYLWDFH